VQLINKHLAWISYSGLVLATEMIRWPTEWQKCATTQVAHTILSNLIICYCSQILSFPAQSYEYYWWDDHKARKKGNSVVERFPRKKNSGGNFTWGLVNDYSISGSMILCGNRFPIPYPTTPELTSLVSIIALLKQSSIVLNETTLSPATPHYYQLN